MDNGEWGMGIGLNPVYLCSSVVILKQSLKE